MTTLQRQLVNSMLAASHAGNDPDPHVAYARLYTRMGEVLRRWEMVRREHAESAVATAEEVLP